MGPSLGAIGMRTSLLLSPVLALVALGCNEYTIEDKSSDITDEIDDGDPDIEVDPVKINFGELAVGEGETKTETVTVSNVGEGSLSIDDLYLADTAQPFSYSAIGAILIPAGTSTTFTVTYAPITAEDNGTNIVIESNDPDEASTLVKLNGSGVAPIIQLDPVSYSFGTLYIGCEGSQPVTISNIGNADLVVSDFDYVTASDDMSLDDNTVVNGDLPWTIGPGDSREVYVNYAPLDDYPDEGFVVVTSNDPLQGEAQAQQAGSGELYGENLDVFEQSLQSSTDILFVIDNSCSMAEEQTNLADNFASFAAVLAGADYDYQVAVITTDNPDFRGDIITPDTPDLEDEFVAQALAGTSGSGDERPSEMAYNATQAGGDAGPGSDFLRDDSKFSLIVVTDEPDSSTGDWSTYMNHFWSLKDDTDLVVVSAIAGDWPSGCATASPSEKFYYMSVATGGLYLSVCATDWASHLESIAEASKVDLSSFELTQPPVPETIEVRIDGVIQTDGWTYNDIDQSVDFDDDHIPPGGSVIEVEYALYGNCAE